MYQLVSLLTFGFFLGLQHAFEADHVAAVSTLSVQTKGLRCAARLGVWWGLGHTLVIVLAGVAVMVFRLQIFEIFTQAIEKVVGVALIFLGAQVFYHILRRDFAHSHQHEHFWGAHEHAHTHSHITQNDESHAHEHKSFFLGLLHGLAGSGAVTLLVASAVSDIIAGIGLLLLFGIGSIAGMTVVSAFLSIPMRFSERLSWLQKSIHIVAGAMSIAIGASMFFSVAVYNFWQYFILQ